MNNKNVRLIAGIILHPLRLLMAELRKKDYEAAIRYGIEMNTKYKRQAESLC